MILELRRVASGILAATDALGKFISSSEGRNALQNITRELEDAVLSIKTVTLEEIPTEEEAFLCLRLATEKIGEVLLLAGATQAGKTVQRSVHKNWPPPTTVVRREVFIGKKLLPPKTSSQ